jgi:aryl-alcohol dehydrogenase-like predicted oxidoreductase
MSSSRRTFIATGLALPAAGLALPSSADPLPKRRLGKTGMEVTRVGFGCMVTSDASVISRAADMGINYFDTARGYQSGNNERMVGAALKGRRNQLFLSTKSGGAGKAEALQHLDTSLRELSTDHVDIWYLHAKGKASDITDDLLDAQQAAKRAGKIRFAGVSTHGGHEEVINAAIACGKIDVILLSYNFTMGTKLNPLIAKAKAAGIGIVAMKVMAGGFRRNKEGEPTHSVLKREGAMASALKWVLKNPDVDTSIPSMTDADQLDENFHAASVPFGAADEKTLAAQLDYIRPLYCRMCGSCSGTCPQGLPVSDVLRYLTYVEGYGQFALGRERFLELPERIAAVRCGDCSACPVHCPNGVQIRERLTRAQEILA